MFFWLLFLLRMGNHNFFHFRPGKFSSAAPIRDWENRPADQKTWPNIKSFISAEYAKENKQNKLAVKNFISNMIKESARR